MCLIAKGGAKKKKQDPRKGTWDEATDSDSEDEKVAPKKSTKKKKEVPKEEVTNSDSEGEDEEVMTVESLLPKLNCVMKQLLKEHEKVKALTRSNKKLMKGLEEYDESYEELSTKYENLLMIMTTS